MTKEQLIKRDQKSRQELIREMAQHLPSHIAVKIQGRSLASIGENVAKRNPERYMYQFFARERMRDFWEQQQEQLQAANKPPTPPELVTVESQSTQGFETQGSEAALAEEAFL